VTRQRERLERLHASLADPLSAGDLPLAPRRGGRSYGHLGLRAWGWWRSVTVPVRVQADAGQMDPALTDRGSLE
jgi:hypothetical protein